MLPFREVVQRTGGDMRPHPQAELRADVLSVRLGGALRDLQASSDLAVAEATGDQRRHLPLPRCFQGREAPAPPVAGPPGMPGRAQREQLVELGLGRDAWKQILAGA